MTCPNCRPSFTAGSFIALNNPCAHVTRLQVIAARLNDSDELNRLMNHLANCTEKG